MTQRTTNHACKSGRMAAIAMVALLVCAIPTGIAWSAEDASSCLSSTGEAAIAPCRQELLRDPGNVEIRFALSDAYMGLRRYADAVAVLQEGLENFPGEDAIKKKLILAESYLDEQKYIEKQQKSAAAASRSKKQDTQIRLSIIRCEKLTGDAALAACNEGLSVNPGHPELLMGRGKIWLEMDRFGNAIRDYEAALSSDPKNREATKNLRFARTKREVKVAQCLQGDGLSGLKACDAALMKGASDEFAVQKRRAGLLQAMGREKEAVGAYQAAAHLNPDDGQITQSLAALSPRSEKQAIQPAPEPSPIVSQATGESTAKPLPPPEKKSPTKPIAPASAPRKTMVAKSKPPAPSPPTNALDRPEVKKPGPEATPSSTPPMMAAGQPRLYSNAPEVPGIPH